MIYTVGAIFFAFFFLLWCCSRLSLVVYAKRCLAITSSLGNHHLLPDIFKEQVLH
ncbi:MAG: hypothetical protein MZV70_14065 [Desulfobacterales bacterium]|nr:hypothetical protein [Desulfobacterales bacterium]